MLRGYEFIIILFCVLLNSQILILSIYLTLFLLDFKVKLRYRKSKNLNGAVLVPHSPMCPLLMLEKQSKGTNTELFNDKSLNYHDIKFIIINALHTRVLDNYQYFL